MSIRTVRFTVNPREILPITAQFGGLQGEHNATTVYFNLSNDFYSQLMQIQNEGKTVVYRIDAFDSSGAVLRTESKILDFSVVSFSLGENLTRNGGKLILYLVFSLLDENEKTEVELYSFPARLRLESTPTQTGEMDASRESLSGLERSAKAAARSAEEQAEISKDAAALSQEAAKKAQTAQRQTAEARLALEENTQFVFDGGNASSVFNTALAVDGFLSELSENPVQNKVLYAALAEKFDKENLSAFLEDPTIQSAFFLAAHPVGTIYYTNRCNFGLVYLTQVQYETGDYYVLIDGVYRRSYEEYSADETYYEALPISPKENFGGEWELFFTDPLGYFAWKRVG